MDLLEEPDEEGVVATLDTEQRDWLEVILPNGTSKPIHRASILNLLFDSGVCRLAVDHVYAVRGYTRDHCKTSLNSEEFTGNNSFNIGDIAVCPIWSAGIISLALIRVMEIETRERGKKDWNKVS